jgi:peptide/nickel transport system substrate-binding protein
MKRLTSITVILLLVLGLIMTTLISGIAAGKDSINVAVAAAPQTMNPHGSDADCNLSVMANIFEGLLYRDVAGELGPGLATSWERVDDLTWRFTLRQGVKFHNGNDFTWEDVKFSFGRLKEPFPVSEMLDFGGITKSVEIVNGDPWTIDIKTTISVPYFAQNLLRLRNHLPV